MKRPFTLLLLVCAPLLAASLPPEPEDPNGTKITEERVGAFRLELVHYRDTRAEAAPAPREWKRIRMVWRSRDGLGQAVVEDNGYSVQRSYRLQSADGKEICMGDGGLSRYSGRRNPETFIRDYLSFLRTCSGSAPLLKAHQEELRGALGDITAAGDRMRALAIGAFGALDPRCIRYKRVNADPMWLKCTRHSKAEKRS